MSTDVSRLVTQGVQEVVPLLMRRQLSYTFVEHARGWQADDSARALRSSFHRLYLGAADLLKQGFLAFHAVARPHRSGGCMLRLHVGGTGLLYDSDKLEQTLLGLQLAPFGGEVDGLERLPAPGLDHVGPAPGRARHGLRRAHGWCPVVAAPIEFSCVPDAGYLLRITYALPGAARLPTLPVRPARAVAAPPAPSSVLWLVHADRVNAGSVTRQAQAHGWTTVPMASLEEATRRLRELPGPQARPAMVVVFASDGAPPAALRALRELLPARSRVVYAAELGSIWRRDGSQSSALAGCELCCHPFGEAEWRRWSGGPAPGDAGQSGVPEMASRRTPVLVVDDDEFCRDLAEGLLGALGCEIRTAHDGRQAIDGCCADAPSLVLMDLDMPEVDGFEATRQLREMQRGGQLPPFRILATSSAPDRSWIQRALEAGCDAFLPKPLRLETLRGELARWSPDPQPPG